MAKVIFEFDSVEEQDEIRMCLDAHKWYLTVDEIKNRLRSVLKYNNGLGKIPYSESLDNFAEEMSEQIYEILNDYKLNL